VVPDDMTTQANTAVVIGGSVAGLLVARVLSRHFARVVVVERGVRPHGPQVRRSVPQGEHLHAMLAGGLQAMERLFPDLREGLRAAGACFADIGDGAEWHHFGVRKRTVRLGIDAALMTRPLLEWEIARRVAALPSVEIAHEQRATRLLLEGGRVRALVMTDAAGAVREIPADLVVDASGRGAAGPGLLAEAGRGVVPEVSTNVRVGYATRMYRRSPRPWHAFLYTPTPPRETRGAVVFAVEGDRWQLSVAGCVGDYPPTDEHGFRAFAASLPRPEVHEIVASGEPLGPIVPYRFPSSLRRRYERMALPEGFIAVGDALCSFNPIYGQGMTVAALEALALDDELARGRGSLTRRFQRRAAKIVDLAWNAAIGEDLRYPQVEGPRPWPLRLINRYTARVLRAAGVDDRVATAFYRTLHCLAPPTALLAPGVVLRALRKGGSTQVATPRS
jgi:flavin-dependent dehydrogenase